MKCPLCKSDMKHNVGVTDAGGVRSWPSVSCSCGFHFSPNLDHVSGRVGQSDWKYSYTKIAEGNRIIKEIFGEKYE
jgi:hypothetical protein